MQRVLRVAAMRIATWNVERPRPKGRKIPQAQLRCMGAVNAVRGEAA
jgi:hypothetical protein